MADIIQIRRDTAANWTSVNPTLANSEMGYETDTTKSKMGDGVTAWTALGYHVDPTASGASTVKVSANDTTAGYVEDKLVVSHGTNTTNPLELSTLNDGADEDRQLQFDEAKVDHDQLLNFLAAEHIDWAVTGGEDIHVDRITAAAITQHVASINHDSLLNTHDLTSDIDHDQLANFESDEHTDAMVKGSSNDSTPGYLEDKVVVSDGANTTYILELSTLNEGVNEDVQIQIDEAKINHANLLNLTTGDPHTQYQLESEKSAANGYASLGATTLVPTAELGTGSASSASFLRGDGTWAAPSGSGDMLASVYDPTSIVGDAFDMDNMVEGTTTKILTDTERTGIAANTSARHTQGTDTTLGVMAADINMNSLYQIVSLQAPAALGEAIRQTANITEANLEQLTDGSDTTLHDHDGISENTSARHTQGTDTTLGTMVADINMNSLYQVTNLQAPGASGEAIRQTTNITESSLEQLTDGSDTTLHDHDGISENTAARHAQGTDTTLGTMTADINMNSLYQVVGLQAPAAAGEAIRQTVNITEADLETLTDGSNADALHVHAGGGLFSEDANSNVVGGTNAGSELSAGYYNFFGGVGAGQYGDSHGNTGIGHQALGGVTGQDHLQCTGIGYQAGLAITTANWGVFVGYQAGVAISSGAANTVVGARAGTEISTGASNAYCGESAGRYGNGSGNVGVGYLALEGTTLNNNSNNTGIGRQVGQLLTTGSSNVFIGYQAGVAVTVGANNVLLGDLAGDNITSGSTNIIIGSNIDPLSATANNQFALGNSTYSFLRGDMANYQLAIYGAGGYLNFNTTLGSGGYGIRDNTGTMEFKDNLGSWTGFTTGGVHTITSHSDVVDATGAQLEELTGGGDTVLHDHDGISENTSARHTQGSDTALGAMSEDIDMNSLYQLVSLAAPAASGEAIRQTTNITEANLETLTDNSVADPLHRHTELVASDGDPDPAFWCSAAGWSIANFDLIVVGDAISDELRAYTSAGLSLKDDSGTLGIFIADGGRVITYGSILTITSQYEGKTLTVTVDDASAVFGNALYCAADFHYERCDANATGTMPCRALALESGTGSKLVLLEGQICNTSWTWVNGDIYVSGTTGELTQTAPAVAGDQVQRVGWALSADTIYFRPDSTVIEIA